MDTQRAPIVKKMFEKVAYEQWSGRKLYHWLKFEINLRSATSNKPLTLSNIYKVLQTLFYYGSFEYPLGSGQWYQGKHKPIITRELFDKAKEQLKRDRIVRGESKEFAFTRLLKCGLCGSGVCAEEKFKQLKTTGLTVRYVYYGCSRSRDLHCKNGYIREEELIKQLLEIIDKIGLDELGTREKIEQEVKKYRKFQSEVLKVKNEKIGQKEAEIDIRNYAKYMLKEGTMFEKRELLANLKSKLVLKDKMISLEK